MNHRPSLCRTFTSWLHHQIQSLIASRSSVSQSLCSDADRLLIMETLLLMTMAAPAGLTMNCQYLFTTPTIFRNPCQSDEDFSKSLLSSNWSLENYSFQKLKYTFLCRRTGIMELKQQSSGVQIHPVYLFLVSFTKN